RRPRERLGRQRSRGNRGNAGNTAVPAKPPVDTPQD
ncbi:bis(5'-nucleosyl)-tetraphosphatase, partial [Xanthomonas oryzae pv. oryzae]